VIGGSELRARAFVKHCNGNNGSNKGRRLERTRKDIMEKRDFLVKGRKDNSRR